MRMATVTRVLVCLILASACGAEVSPEGAGGSENLIIPVKPPVYLEEVIPPCVPLTQTDVDPCASGPIEPFPAAKKPADEDSSVAATPMPILEVPSVEDIMLGKFSSRSQMEPILIRHIVIRGTVQVGTTRCHDYYLKLPNYRVKRSNEGLIRVHCFSDVRVNEYLVGSGPPVLPVSLYVNVTSFSDREGYSDREETIASYGGDDVWIANLFGDPAGRVAQAYEGKEVVLFLRLPFAITLEALDANGAFALWLVQRDEDGTIRVAPEEVIEIRDPVKRAEGNIPLAELERRIAAAAVNRNTVTGGRIGIDPSLPLLVSDANHLRSHYLDIGAVYVTHENIDEDIEHPTRLPPPSPGGGVVDPISRTGAPEDEGDDQTPPRPGDDTPPPGSTPEDTTTTTPNN